MTNISKSIKINISDNIIYRQKVHQWKYSFHW